MFTNLLHVEIMAELNQRAEKIVSDINVVLTAIKRNELLTRLPFVRDLEAIQTDAEVLCSLMFARSDSSTDAEATYVENESDFGKRVIQMINDIDTKATIRVMGMDYPSIREAAEAEITNSWAKLKKALRARYDGGESEEYESDDDECVDATEKTVQKVGGKFTDFSTKSNQSP